MRLLEDGYAEKVSLTFEAARTLLVSFSTACQVQRPERLFMCSMQGSNLYIRVQGIAFMLGCLETICQAGKSQVCK